MTLDPFEIGDNYGEMVQQKLIHVLKESSPEVVGKIIRRVLEELVITERIAREKGVDIDDHDRRKIVEKEYPDIQEEVDRAMGGFIGSILSREGG